MSVIKRLIARTSLMLAVLALLLVVFMVPGIGLTGKPTAALAAGGGSTLYSVSHYVSFTATNTLTAAQNETNHLIAWAKRDAQVEDPLGDNSSCAPNYYAKQIVTVLDFGQPTPTSSGAYGIRNWQFVTFSYAQIEGFVETYASQWYLSAGVCDHLFVAIGTNNSNECLNPSNATCVYNEGHGLALAVSTVASWIAATTNSNPTYNDFSLQVQVIGGDDIENNETDYDTYNQTKNFVQGFTDFNIQNHTGYSLLDYGDAFPCGAYNPQQPNNPCGNGNTDLWTYGQIYNVAWGIGWDEALPEVYSQYHDDGWAEVYNQTANGCADCIGQGALQFSGVMNDDGLQNQSYSQATLFWKILGNRGTGLGTNWNTCMPALSTSQAGGASPCD